MTRRGSTGTPAAASRGGLRAFRTAAALRAWYKQHGSSAGELVLRCFKVHARHRGIGYKEGLDEALCFGWIDGIRRAVDDESYSVRFTPRRNGSVWSAVNIRRVEELRREGRMQDAGLVAWAQRDRHPDSGYSIKARDSVLSPAFEARFRAAPDAWAHFQQRAPSYRRDTVHWVMSAKREETRARRLAVLIECSARGEPIPLLARSPRPAAGRSTAPVAALRRSTRPRPHR